MQIAANQLFLTTQTNEAVEGGHGQGHLQLTKKKAKQIVVIEFRFAVAVIWPVTVNVPCVKLLLVSLLSISLL